MSKENFKMFVRSHPELVHYVTNNQMTWQKFYELYNLYDEDDNLLGTAIAGLNELKKDVVYDFKALSILKADDVEKVDHYTLESVELG